MKITHWYDVSSKLLKIHMESEDQKESNQIVEIANRIAAPAYSYGRVNSENTWAWIFIPLKHVESWADYFGTKPRH
jgi:hypothetical protein